MSAGPSRPRRSSAERPRCPWCGKRVKLGESYELRYWSRIWGNVQVVKLEDLPADALCWWCTACHAGGAMVIEGEYRDETRIRSTS